MYFEIFLLVILDSISLVLLTRDNLSNAPSPWTVQAENTCYGAAKNAHGRFHMKENCQLESLRSRHLHGNITCREKLPSTRWGCKWKACRPSECFLTLIIKDEKKWLPSKGLDGHLSYKLDGFEFDDDVLVMKKKASLTKVEEFQMWYPDEWLHLLLLLLLHVWTLHVWNNKRHQLED